MKRKILIVEDEKRIRDVIKDYFIAAGYEVELAENGKQAIEKFEVCQPEIILLDIMMPELDGWSVCKKIRKNSDVLLVFLTSRSDEDDKLMGYEFGADDYITKPFSPKVLVARINALINRQDRDKGILNSELVIGDIKINIDARTVSINEKIKAMPPKEYELLLYMMENRGIALSRDMILDKVWGYDYYGDTRAVDTHIKKLRKNLDACSGYIQTVLRVGYKFEVTDNES